MLKLKIVSCLCIRIFFCLDYFSLYHQKNSYFYEIILREKFLDQQKQSLEPLEYLFYYCVPESYANIIVAIIDAVISYYIKDASYFIFATLLFSPIASLENLIILIYLVNKNIDLILPINPFFICLQEGTFYNAMSKYYMINEQLANMTKSAHLPNTNNFWFYYMYVFDQYKPFFTSLINLSCIFMSSLAENDMICKMLVMFLFKKSSYKNFLFLHCLCKKTTRKNKKNFEIFYFLFICLDFYVTNLYKYKGSGNLNFVNWAQFFAYCLFIIDHKVLD